MAEDSDKMNLVTQQEAAVPIVAETLVVPAAEVDGLQGFVTRLTEKGLPVFARTVRDVSGIATRKETSASQLAGAIMQDANMAARLLKVANSPLLNPNKRAINTLSRAVVLMGFKAINNLALSLAVIENLLQGKQKDVIARSMARSFHAAAQAKTFAEKRKDQSPEEVFVATLLFHIGEMAFWASGDKKMREYKTFIEANPKMNLRKAQKQVLGFDIDELTKSLVDEWQLGSLLHGAVREDESNPRISNIVLGHELAETVEAGGWNAPTTKKLILRIAEMLYLPPDAVTAMVQQNAEEASKIAAGYGVASVGKYIPQLTPEERRMGERIAAQEDSATHHGSEGYGDSVGAGAFAEEGKVGGEVDDAAKALIGEPGSGESAFMKPNPMYQLKLLRELAEHLEDKPDLNTMMQLALDGIYRGIGTDRTIFALVNPKRTLLKAKFAVGWDQQKIMQTFLLEVGPGQNSLFRLVLESHKPMWINAQTPDAIRTLITPEIYSWTKDAEFFVLPVVVENKSIGMLYTDRRPSGRPLDEETFSSFKHFGQQVVLGLSFITKKK